jgi:hypothetical protein
MNNDIFVKERLRASCLGNDCDLVTFFVVLILQEKLLKPWLC